MSPDQRVVISLPLAELWDANGPVPAVRGRTLGKHDITALLRSGPVQFVVADTGPLTWIAPEDTHRFWKREVKDHLVAVDADRYDYDGFPGGYCYVATQWEGGDLAASLVLLERHH